MVAHRKIGRCARWSASRPTTSERTSSRWCGRSASSSTPRGTAFSCIDDNSPDGTGQVADALAAELDVGRGAAPPRQGRARAGLHRRVQTGPRSGRRARARDRLRLLSRPERRAPPDRGLRGRRRRRARLAVGGGWRHRQLGHGSHDHLAGRQPLRAHDPRRGRARPHRRVQVLPPRRPRADRSRLRSRPRDTASRSRRPTGRCGPGSRSSRSRSRSSTGGSASRRWTARSSSRRCSRCRRCASGRSAAGCSTGRSPTYTCSWTRSRTRRSPTRCSRATCR